MDNFNSKEILQRLNITQLKSLLKLINVQFTTKWTKDDLLKAALEAPEFSPALVMNYLGLDKNEMEKKMNKPVKGSGDTTPPTAVKSKVPSKPRTIKVKEKTIIESESTQ